MTMKQDLRVEEIEEHVNSSVSALRADIKHRDKS